MRVGAVGQRTVSIADALGAPVRALAGSQLLKRVLRFAYDRYFQGASGQVRLFQGIHADFAAARAALPRNRAVGYDNPASAWRVAEERHRIFDCDYPMLFWLARLMPELRRIFDLGGNVGISYYAWQRYLDYPSGLDWLVCDVPAVVEAGRQLAAKERAPGLRFTTGYEELPAADLLIAAGSLQFIADPFAALERAPSLPRHVLLNKTPLYQRDDAATVQAMGTSFSPYWLFNRARFLARFERLGYRVVDAWTNPGMGARIPFHPEHSIAAFSGCYLVRD